MPKFRAISAIGRPELITSSTASSLYSWVYFLRACPTSGSLLVDHRATSDGVYETGGGPPSLAGKWWSNRAWAADLRRDLEIIGRARATVTRRLSASSSAHRPGILSTRSTPGKRLSASGLAAVSRGRMPGPLGLDNCRGPGGMRRRGGVRLYEERERFRFRAADAAAERDGSLWLRPGTRSAKESLSTRAWPTPPGCMTTGSAGRTTSPPTGRPRSR